MPSIGWPGLLLIQLVRFAIWAFLLWRFYLMAKDITDMKETLRALLEEQKKKGAAPPPEPRPESPES